jgi:hypothetical protein
VSKDLIIGLLMSIPAGVVSGLLVSPIRKWLRHRGVSSRERKREEIKREYILVLESLIYPEHFTHDLLDAAIRAVIGACLLSVCMITTAAGSLLSALDLFKGHPYVSFGLGMFGGVLGFLSGYYMAAAFNQLKRYSRRQGLFNYIPTIPDDLRDKKMELAAIEAYSGVALKPIESSEALKEIESHKDPKHNEVRESR